MQRLSVRTLYAQTEPLHLLRRGERIVGQVVTDEYLPLWTIGHEWRPAQQGRRRHDGRLRKRGRRC
jgi:hypothetical protein